jgi:hypothetical protein
MIACSKDRIVPKGLYERPIRSVKSHFRLKEEENAAWQN